MPLAPADPKAILERGPLKADGWPAFHAHTGALVQDAQTGETLLAQNEKDTFTPASTMKALTTAAALYTLGQDFTFRTAVLLPVGAGARLQRLTLRGSGDPTLRQKGDGNTLEALAQAVASAGIQTIGELRIDDFAFGQARWGNGWMWDDSAYPIGALRLDDAEAMSLVQQEDGTTPNPDLLTDTDTLALAVGECFAALLKGLGVEVGPIRRAQAQSGDVTVAAVESAPLSTLIRLTNKPSNNIYAEQLRAALGVGADGAPSSDETANKAIGDFLKVAGYPDEDYRLRDGSGLTRYNLLSPQQLNALLRYAYLHPIGTDLAPAEAFRQRQNPFVESLPVAGTGETTPTAAENGGTLRNRLQGAGLDVRAKTGTMTGVSGLTGYLTTHSGRVLAFTFLMDNSPAETSDLTRWQDELLVALAGKY